MTELLTNQLVEIKSEGVVFRVLWVDPLGRGYYVIDVRSQAAFPEFRGALELEELLAHDEATLFPDDQWLAPLMDAGLPDSHKERRDRAWELIQPLALHLPDIFKPRVRGEAVAALVAAGTATKQTVYRLLRRYWQRGMVPNALLPDYTRSGARGREKRISPDRRRSGAEGNTYSAVIDADTRQLFLSSIMAYKRNKQLDLRECHEKIVKDHYSERVLNERTGRDEYVARPPYPTLRQFRYWYEKDNDIFHNERIRRTPRVYDKDMRAILGSSTAETVGPGFRPHKRTTRADASATGEGMPEIDPRLGSRRNQHQKALPLLERFSTFNRDIPVDRVKVPKIIAARDTPTQSGHGSAAKRRTAPTAPARFPVSLNPEASQDGLPPIDFKHLERAEDYVGETAWLAAVVRRIAVLCPHIEISMSHFFLKAGREFTKTSRGRRACLVALFQFPDRPPAVLIDVDHTGLRGLAAMMLRYTAECPFAEMEGHIKILLDALVDNSGKWDRKAEADLPSVVTCRRQKKVLRRQGERTPDEMLSVWTERLLDRLAA